MLVLLAGNGKAALKKWIKQRLKSQGDGKVLTCSSEAEIFDTLSGQKPDLILMAEDFGKEEALKLAREIKSLAGESYLVYLTEEYSPANGAKVLEAGADCYCPLNDDYIFLEACLNKCLEKQDKAKGSHRSEHYAAETEERLKKLTDIFDLYQDKEDKLLYISPACEHITGYTAEMFIEDPALLKKIVHPDDWELLQEYRQEIKKGKDVFPIEFRLTRKDGEDRWISSLPEKTFDAEGKLTGIRTVNRDISEKKRLEEAVLEKTDELKKILASISVSENDRNKAEEGLRKSEDRFRSITAAIPDLILCLSHEGEVLEVLNNNQSGGFSSSGLKGKLIREVLPTELAEKYMDSIKKALERAQVQCFEYEVKEEGTGLFFEARIAASSGLEVVALIREITERKNFEERLKQLSFYDQLTGLYNRGYFGEEMKRLEGGRDYPITIISADLDGLKLINDSMGHRQGDELLKACALVLKSPLRSSDVLARVGGDEFIIILPRTDSKAAMNILQRIKMTEEFYNKEGDVGIPLVISLGAATAESLEKTLETTMREADDEMYRVKFEAKEMVRKKIVDALLSVLSDRDFMAEGHGDRMKMWCRRIGQKTGLNPTQLEMMDLLAHVHDLGKIAIPEQVLFKEDKITTEEMELLKQHSEKGSRIARLFPELEPVADLILNHHENWDGSGYPFGKKEADIPLECRILAIADAFDAMTSPRPYRKTKSREEAIAELKRCAGTQFDPKLVEIILFLLKESSWLDLHKAALEGKEEIVRMLIEKGADVNVKSNGGRTPLHWAAAKNTQVARLLISKGADINAKDKYGSSPLHSAASAGNLEIVKILIEEGAEINARDNYGDTPLHDAILEGHAEAAEFLKEAGGRK